MKKIITALSVMILASSMARENRNKLPAPTADQIQKIAAALPTKAPAQPKKTRKILVVTRCEGYVHKSIPVGAQALKMMGDQTGAYTVDETMDLSVFNDADLAKYDAVLFLSTTKLNPSPAQRDALLKFIRSGKGIIGIHAATDSFYKWEAGAKMMGGLFCDHPWTAGCTVQVKLDEPDHPINQCFHGEPFKVKDEIYEFKDPYSRKNQRVLTSLDLSDPDTKAVKGGKPSKVKRTDGDFGITWVRKEGKGRVFYCSFGHNNPIFWNTPIMEHYLAGIQYALGDYDVPDQID